MYVALGVAAAGGGAYYYLNNNPDQVRDLKAKAQRDEHEVKQKARETADAAKSRADDAYRQGKDKFDDVKVSSIHFLYNISIDFIFLGGWKRKVRLCAV